MDKHEAIGALVGLVHLDMDAYFAYSHALAHVRPHVRSEFMRMRNEHLEHVQALRNAIRDAGVEPPALTRDFRGLLFEGMTVLRTIAGPHGAVRAMRSIEETVCRAYAEVLALGLPDNLQMLCERLFADEAAHRHYLQDTVHPGAPHLASRPHATGVSLR